MEENPEADPEMEHHSPDEFLMALAALNTDNRARLRKVMLVLARPPLADGQDLLQEVHCRVLSGSRYWPVGVNLLKFLVDAMRSIANEATEKAGRERGLVAVTEGEAGLGMVVGLANRQGTLLPMQRTATAEEGCIAAEDRAEEDARVRAWRQQAFDAFSGDDTAQLLVEGMLEGYKGKQLQELTGLGDVAFASKQRLIRRRLERVGGAVAARRLV